MAPGRLEEPGAAAALEQLRQRLAALPAEELIAPNLNVPEAAEAALQLVDLVRSEEVRARFESLPARELAPDTAEVAEKAAMALWHVQARWLAEKASRQGPRVDPALVEQGAEVKTRMLRVLEYHLWLESKVAAELADIRAGAGYLDLALDLIRLKNLYEAHRSTLVRDQVAYDERDAATADAIAKQIRAEWRSGEGTELSELRNRCWTLLVGAYGDLRAAAEFLFRKEPSMLSRFKSLRFAVQGSTARPKPEAPEPPAE